jgi:hypothetical protein
MDPQRDGVVEMARQMYWFVLVVGYILTHFCAFTLGMMGGRELVAHDTCEWLGYETWEWEGHAAVCE